MDFTDVKDPDRDSYITWKLFKYPDGTAGGQTAFAMSEGSNEMFIALYTLILTAISMVAWDVFLCLIIIFLAPQKMNRSTYSTLVAIWNCGDPFQSGIMMIRPVFTILWNLIKPKKKKTTIESENREANWPAFWFDMAILVVGLGTFSANVVVGIIFANYLNIGHAAPVNPTHVFYPNMTSYTGAIKGQPNYNAFLQATLQQYNNPGVSRALAGVEGAESKIREHVHFSRKNKDNYTDPSTAEAEENYSMEYSFTVTGVEMGLQHFGQLQFHVNGSCEFEHDWYNRSMAYNETTRESYESWANAAEKYPAVNTEQMKAGSLTTNRIQVYRDSPPFLVIRNSVLRKDQEFWRTGNSYFEATPSTALRRSSSSSRDPWYATKPGNNSNYEIKRGRPTLACIQNDQWSYGSLQNITLGNLLQYPSFPNAQNTVVLPEAIKALMNYKLSAPIIVGLGLSSGGTGALKSASQTSIPRFDIDLRGASAAEDLERLVFATYLATRSLFQDIALAGNATAQSKLTMTENALVKPDGKPMDGIGEFIIRGSQITTVRLGWVVIYPSILAFFILVSAALKYGKKLCKLNSRFRRFSHFILLTTGLSGAQLYRTIDQILLEQSRYHDQPLDWGRQTSLIPYLDDTDEKSPPITEVQIHVVKGSPDQYRLTLGLEGESPPVHHSTQPKWEVWDRKQSRIDGKKLYLADMAEQHVPGISGDGAADSPKTQHSSDIPGPDEKGATHSEITTLPKT